MSWATNRKLTIVIIVVAVLIALIAVTLIATLHHTPSCTDNIQNQDEQGVDCGGSCPYLCRALEQAPVTLFTRAISNQPGRTDVVALIQNQNNTAGAKRVPYTVSLYGTDGSVVKTIQGTIDLPPALPTGGKVPIFIPGAVATNQTITNASLSIDPQAVLWYALATDPRIVPTAGNYVLTDASSTPHLTATLTNPSVTPLTNVKAIVVISDPNQNVMAASQTIVPLIPANGSASATFTWNQPFPYAAGSISVMPVISLP